MTTFRKRYSLTFLPHPLGRGCVCGQNICYHIAVSVVSFNLICNMTTFRKKIKFDLLTPPPGSRVCLWAKYLLSCCCQRRQLLFDMQHDYILIKFNFDLDPTPYVHPTGSDPGLQTKIPFDMFHIYCCSACMQISAKILTIALVIAKFKYLTFDPLGGVKGNGVNFGTAMLIYRHLATMFLY